MAQTIEMARLYSCRPSEFLELTGYEAYCFDEVALFLLSEATDKEGRVNWKRIRWKTDKPKSNKELVDFIKLTSGI